MNNPKLGLEILNGPLDGYMVTLEAETVWGRAGDGPLSFAWDKELAEQQARFFIEEGRWWIEGYDAPHGTYFLNPQQRLDAKTPLEHGHLLKASDTWLLVSHIEYV
jgi:hypothetical protein